MIEDALPQDERQQAAELDHLIAARQTGQRAEPPIVIATDATDTIDALLHLASTTAPTQEFVVELEKRLQSPYPQAGPQQTPNGWRMFLSQISAQRLPPWQLATRKLALATVTLFLCLVGFLLTAPVVRATLWDWLYGFGLIQEAQVTEQPILLEAPIMRSDAPAALTLAALQQQAPFPIHPPTGLPAGLHFTGGFVLPTESGTQVTLAYHTSTAPAGGYPPDAPLLFVAISNSALPNRPLVAEGYQQDVTIGQQVGVYTRGNWRSETPLTAEDTQIDHLVWDSTADGAWLAWQANGLHYLLYAQGVGFRAEEMVQVAETME